MRLRVSPDLRAAARTYDSRKRIREARSNRVMRALWQDRVVARYLTLADHGRRDAHSATQDIQEIEAEIEDSAPGLVRTWYDPLVMDARSNARAFVRRNGLEWKDHDGAVIDAIETRRKDSIALVTKANRIYAGAVEQVFSRPDVFGLMVEEIRGLLQDIGDVSESRAALIARDQTLKLYAGLTEASHRANGIERYVWSTSDDERVRPEHAKLEGQVFAYTAPPEPGNPGEDYQCRCNAIPVLED